jgi:tetratricopeptide (TPR) repeat protein
MNSWHSFSSNGRWLVFSSKANTPYTQLFLTHIDDAGESTPPLVLERFTGEDRAANIPEFVPLPAGSIAKIQERFLDAYSFLRAGMANERTGNYPGAVRAYERGLAVEPENVEILNSLGFALFQQGKSQEAVVALEKALAVDPKHVKAHNNIALASIDLGELELAEAHYRESLAIEPQAAIHSDLGFVLERQGLADEAIEQYQKALELDPASASAHYNLGGALVRRRESAAAAQHFRAALEHKPSAPAYAGLGLALYQQGEVDEAIASLRAGIAADPKHPAAYDQLGTILVEQGKLEEAASNYRLLVHYRPSAAAHQKLAEVLMRLGRTDEARKEMEMAKALDPNLGEAR